MGPARRGACAIIGVLAAMLLQVLIERWAAVLVEVEVSGGGQVRCGECTVEASLRARVGDTGLMMTANLIVTGVGGAGFDVGTLANPAEVQRLTELINALGAGVLAGVAVLGVRGFGVGEALALGSYALLHRFLLHESGPPRQGASLGLAACLALAWSNDLIEWRWGGPAE